MLTTFDPVKLNEWVSNFEKNPQVPSVTTSALISLAHLEHFIREIKNQQADCIRVYFLKFKDNESPYAPVLVNGVPAKGCEWVKAGQQLSQTAIALVPAKNFKHDKDFVFSAEDIVAGGRVLKLLPGTENEGTGLNPPGTSGGKTGG